MSNKLVILVVSKKTEAIDSIEKLLREGGYDMVSRRLLIEGDKEPIYAVDKVPEMIVFHVSDRWRQELENLIAIEAVKRPALLVIADTADAEMLHMAMHAGALDLLTFPLVKEDFLKAIGRVSVVKSTIAPREAAQVISFMNTNGGCGSTFLAVNVAHVLATKFNKRVGLVDLDLQFGTLPFYLNMYPRQGISKALENLGTIDEEAVKGYFARHSSGVEVLTNGIEPGAICKEVDAEQVMQLLKIASYAYDYLILDLPRHVEHMTKSAIMNSSHVALVMQQSVLSMACASKIVNCLRQQMGLTNDQLFVVVNRYYPPSPVKIDEISNTLKVQAPIVVSNDFDLVSECVNTGIPLLDKAKNSAVAKSIIELASRLSGIPVPVHKSGLLSGFSSLLVSKDNE